MGRLKVEYHKILKWLESLNENRIVPGLERMEKLMMHLGNPEKELEIVMIGGTNAKGSTCFSLNSTLSRGGFKTGCFTSPHLHSVRERILIGNEIIPMEEFNACLAKIKDITEEFRIKPTYFEVLTSVAYYYFHSKNVDYAIMEIGLGGEWDAVNIGKAKIAILTTLGFEHEEYLGNTLESIAKTKARIVDEETAVITGWPSEYHALIPECQSLVYGKEIADWIGHVLKVLKLNCPVNMVQVSGRYEIAGDFTLDTAHNVQAIRFLIDKKADYQKILIGILKDKNVEEIIGALPKNSELLLCSLETERGVPLSRLKDACIKQGYMCKEFGSVGEAMEYATGSETLVTGSFYTISAAREFLKLEGHDEL
ncbi:MAG: Mur ligase family protein [Candidatus Thermoplasmatota archaeon]|nr:Mur ligase family protein [Candidatus Thermoplasmatota archaeon]